MMFLIKEQKPCKFAKITQERFRIIELDEEIKTFAAVKLSGVATGRC